MGEGVEPGVVEQFRGENRGLVDQNLGAHAINGQLSRQGVGSKTVRQTAVIARLYDRDKTDSHEAVITLAGKL